MGDCILARFSNVDISDIANQINVYEYIPISAKQTSWSDSSATNITRQKVMSEYTLKHPISAIVLANVVQPSKRCMTEYDYDRNIITHSLVGDVTISAAGSKTEFEAATSTYTSTSANSSLFVSPNMDAIRIKIKVELMKISLIYDYSITAWNDDNDRPIYPSNRYTVRGFGPYLVKVEYAS